jgi:hypothetical protein
MSNIKACNLLQVEVTLRLMDSQSVCRNVEPTVGLVARYYFLSESCFIVSVGSPSLRRGQVCHLSLHFTEVVTMAVKR